MSSTKKITEAKTTCDGLQRLVRKLNVAAVDLDKSGGSAHDLMALLASTHACVHSLSTQLDELAGEVSAAPAERNSAPTDSNTITPLHRSGKSGNNPSRANPLDGLFNTEDNESETGTPVGAVARR